MYTADSRLPHVLPPSAYFSPDFYQAELASLFLKSWHVVGTTGQLSRPGDFLTGHLFGVPIQVRNFQGQLRAVSNVCAHRHCLLSSEAAGHSERLVCQYHGWEYDDTGRTRRIPDAKNFAPFDRDAARLPAYAVATCGQLVFVRVSQDGPALESFLGELFPICAERFGANWRPTLVEDRTHQCNWKVPVEGTLEAYHVPCVHPNTFRESPQEQHSTHQLDDFHTALGTRLPFSPHSRLDAMFQRLEARFVGWLGKPPTGEYWHHHCFPNLMFSFTDAVSLCQCVIPTGPVTCRSVVRQFGYDGASRGPRSWLAHVWGRMAAGITSRILNEDRALFPDVQRGLEASPHAGMLGRCEERIHAFQVYVDRNVNAMTSQDIEEKAAGRVTSCNGVGVHP
jgi:phenylpropionate dioxygenase-like ring-hydroxylating dioxygenase large terminal subunit